MNVDHWVHTNVNCSDFERSRVFYERLGFQLVAMAPATNTAEVAAAVGLPPYLVKGGLFALNGNMRGPMLDLLEWQEPRDPEAPYAQLNHLGLARIALRTTDLDADIRELRQAGVELISEEPGEVVWSDMPTSRFICFKDPDGSVVELVEMSAPSGAAAGGGEV